MSTPPKIPFACPIPWSEMKGSDDSRHCAACGHTIHNLSALTADERAELLHRARSEKICGTYLLRLSGELVTSEAPLSPREARGIRQVGAVVLSAGAMALVAGCVAHSPEKKTESPKPTKEIQSAANPAGKEEVVQLVGFFITTEEEKAQIPAANKK